MDQTGAKTKGRIFMSCKREKHYSRELMLDQHALVYVFAGTLEIAYADQLHTFYPGEAIIIPRNQLGRLSKLPAKDAPFTSISILFPEALLHRFYTEHPVKQTVEKWSGHLKVKSHLLVESLFNSLASYFDLQEELPAELAEIKIWETLTVLDKIAPQSRHILNSFHEPGKVDLIDFMEQNFIYNLPLEKFAYLTGRSLSSFKKDFKNVFHATPGKWLTEKRLERAHYQIAVQKKRPSDVYLDSGFEDLSHFSFAFKKQYGVSPSEVK